MRRLGSLVAAVALLAGMAACSGSSSDEDGALRLELDGTASVVRDGDRRTVDGGNHRLRAGDVVEVTTGSAVLSLPGDGVVELRAGLGRRPDTKVEAGDVPALLAGDLLVRGDDEVRVSAAGSDLVLDGGAARLSRSLSVQAAVYEGEGMVESGGRSVAVPAFRQVVVTDVGLVPREADPLRWDRRHPDPWDVRFLGDAIALSNELDDFSRGVTRNARDEAGKVAFYRSTYPALRSEPDFDQELLDRARSTTGETLVGTVIAMLSRHDGAFDDRFDQVFDFRRDGAAWGLVALDHGLARGPLLEALVTGGDQAPVLFASAPSGTGGGVVTGIATGGPTGGVTDGTPTPTPSTSPGGTTTPTTPPDDGPPPTTPPPTTPPPTTPPPPTVPTPTVPEPPVPEPTLPDPPPPVDEVLDPVVEPVEDLVGGIIGQPTGAVTDTAEGLLGGVTGGS